MKPSQFRPNCVIPYSLVPEIGTLGANALSG